MFVYTHKYEIYQVHCSCQVHVAVVLVFNPDPFQWEASSGPLPVPQAKRAHIETCIEADLSGNEETTSARKHKQAVLQTASRQKKSWRLKM